MSASDRARRKRLLERIAALEEQHALQPLAGVPPRVQRLIGLGLWEATPSWLEKAESKRHEEIASVIRRDTNRGGNRHGVATRLGGDLVAANAAKPRIGHVKSNGGRVRS